MRSYKYMVFTSGGSRRSSKSSRKCWKRHAHVTMGEAVWHPTLHECFSFFNVKSCRCAHAVVQNTKDPNRQLLRAGESGEVSSAVNLAHILVRFYSAKSQ